jgi:hypothetical protein
MGQNFEIRRDGKLWVLYWSEEKGFYWIGGFDLK